ncbi:hypothetical protein ACO0SA_002161 [Hanseniaspora valbyensis]
MSENSDENAFNYIFSKGYLKNSINSNIEEQNDDIPSEQSETIDINNIQSFINELVASIYEDNKTETVLKENEELVIKYLLKITFDDLIKFSNCNLNNIIIIGILAKLNYFNDILLMEFFQALLKSKQLNKIKILINLLGESINDENLISEDIKNNLLEILNRRKIELPIYPEKFEWEIIFNLCDSLDRKLEAFDITKEDLSNLTTFAIKKDISPIIIKKDSDLEDLKERKTTDYKRLIYLIIKSSGTSDEIVHKILNLGVKKHEDKLSIIQTIMLNCSEEKLYSKLYENIVIKLCDVNGDWEDCLEEDFANFYLNDIEDEEVFVNLANITNLSKMFARLLAEDALDFKVLQVVKINQRDTTEKKRVFLKFLFKELVMDLSLEKVKKIMLKNKKLKPYLRGSIFPNIENGKDMIYSMNFFTAIDLAELTVNMRKELEKNRNMLKEQAHNKNKDIEEEDDNIKEEEGEEKVIKKQKI